MNETVITFDNLCFKVKNKLFTEHGKLILKGISGDFRKYELSAVVGASGCGKTTLLNVLSGFETKNVCGSIRVNYETRNDKSFRRGSTYIMHEQNLFLLLSVQEAMNFAMKLKTGNSLTNGEQKAKIVAILTNLGLLEKLNEFSRNLSSGEQKRLSIALELVDDPAILFLDEPTTGLDSSSSAQCIRLLKDLTKEGKAVICSIHTPSTRLLEMFDHLYSLADGNCIYQGSTRNLVPFLKDMNLACPPSYNPCDYLLEIASEKLENERLIEKIENGSSNEYRNEALSTDYEITKAHISTTSSNYSSVFLSQFRLLMFRNYLLMKRDIMILKLRLFFYILVGVLVGLLYYGIGNDAEQIINVLRFASIAIGFLNYAGLYTLLIRFPLEYSVVKREHFNRWYSTGAYYLALIASDVPIIIVCTILFVVIIYVLTDLPMESFRFFNFLLVGVLSSLNSQSYGLLIGSMFKIKTALMTVAVYMQLQIVFCGSLIAQKDIPGFLKWLFEINYAKASVESSESLILGYNRRNLECKQIYCYFQDPRKFMDFSGLQENLSNDYCTLLISLLLIHIISYWVMWYKLKNVR